MTITDYVSALDTLLTAKSVTATVSKLEDYVKDGANMDSNVIVVHNQAFSKQGQSEFPVLIYILDVTIHYRQSESSLETFLSNIDNAFNDNNINDNTNVKYRLEIQELNNFAIGRVRGFIEVRDYYTQAATTIS